MGKVTSSQKVTKIQIVNILRIIQAFLSFFGKQRTKVNNLFSKAQQPNIKTGVPQGSITNAFLFYIFFILLM